MKTADKLLDVSNVHLLDNSAAEPPVMLLTVAEIRLWWDQKRPDIADDDAISFLFAALDYYRCGMETIRPHYIPARVRLYGVACGDGPFAGTRAAAGDYDCTCNQWGARKRQNEFNSRRA